MRFNPRNLERIHRSTSHVSHKGAEPVLETNPNVLLKKRNTLIHELHLNHKIPCTELVELYASNVVNKGMTCGVSINGRLLRITDQRSLIDWTQFSERLKREKALSNGRLFCHLDGQELTIKEMMRILK